MKKIIFYLCLVLCLCLSSCKGNKEISETRFVLDTVATLTADCDQKALNGAFELCYKYENMLSATNEDSEVARLNSAEGFLELSQETVEIIEKSLYYSKLSKGYFDITIRPLSKLWDFKNNIIPSNNEIADALKNIDYQAIEINGRLVNLNRKQIDLGGIAKGYIADKITDYLKQNGTESGIVNLGGNVVTFGMECKVGINRPFGSDNIAILKLEDKSVVTSGIYQRYIKEGDKIYHHILDKTTGYGVENELSSVTVIGDSSLDCDALSTVLLLLGTEKGMKLIEETDGFEAVFINKNEEITLSSGIYKKNGLLYLK